MSTELDCVFCAIAAGRSSAHVVHQDELTMAILDHNPLARGHCLVIPKRHVPWWHDLDEKEIESAFRVAREVARKIMIVLEPDFVCMYVRGRRVPHTHIFLVPTWSGDPLDRHFNALEGFQEGAAQMAELAKPGAMEEIAAELSAA